MADNHSVSNLPGATAASHPSANPAASATNAPPLQPSLNFSALPRDALHKYRTYYSLRTPSSFHTPQNEFLLSRRPRGHISRKAPSVVVGRKRKREALAEVENARPADGETGATAEDGKKVDGAGMADKSEIGEQDEQEEVTGWQRQSRLGLEREVRKHFNGMAVKEDDVLVKMLYLAKWQEREFRARPAPPPPPPGPASINASIIPPTSATVKPENEAPKTLPLAGMSKMPAVVTGRAEVEAEQMVSPEVQEIRDGAREAAMMDVADPGPRFEQGAQLPTVPQMSIER